MTNPDDKATEDAAETVGIPDVGPAMNDVDERWTIPWAVVEGEGQEPAAGAALLWHGLGATFSHGGQSIPRPMLYTSEGPAADTETSCIDLGLPIGEPSWEEGQPVAHWTSYSALTPTQRGNYLAWLASGRRLPLDDMNYAFLYFYGLERYALIDKGDPEDVLRVLMSLVKHYEDAPSFFSSVSRLAAFLFATKGIERLKPAWFQRLFMQQTAPLHGDALAVATTWLYERGKPLPAALAFEIARQDIRCSHKGSYATEGDAFARRFTAAYEEKFGEGLLLEIAAEQQTWKYRPINPSLQSWKHFGSLWSVTSADVMGAYGQFEPLISLWRECEAEQEGGSDWQGLIDTYASPKGRVVVPVSAVATCLGLPWGKKSVSLLESIDVTEKALAAGYELLPSPANLLRPFKARERVVLTRATARHADSEPCFLAGVLLLALGTSIAEVDGTVDHVEVLHVSEIVNSLYHFNDDDKHRLGVLRRRLIKFPPKLTSLTRRVKAILTEEECVEAGKFLVGVAAANFAIQNDEGLALRRAYRALGISVVRLDELFSTLLSPDGEQVNRDRLAQLMRETKAFAYRLGVAMQGVKPLRGAALGKRGIWYGREVTAPETSPMVAERVADPYCDALYALIQRGDWTDGEFVALAKQHGVLVEGVESAMDAWEETVSDDGGVDRYVLTTSDEDDGDL